MKKLLSLTLMLCILALSIVGCGTSNTPAPSSSNPTEVAKEPVTVTVWMGSWWENQVPKIVEAYEKSHDNVKLKIETFPMNGFLDKAISASLGGSAPDVIDLEGSMISAMAGKNLLTPLDDYAKDLDAKDFIPGIWNMAHLDGKLYGFPNRSTATVTFYNKTMFDEAGVAYPTSDWTYENMLEIAKKLTNPAKGQYGLGIAAAASDPPNVFSSLAPTLWGLGGDFLSADQTKAVINEPNGVKAIEYWTGLYNKEKVVPEGTLNYTITKDVMPLFMQNKVAMFALSGFTMESLKKDPNVKWGIVNMPGDITSSGGFAYAIPASAKNPQAGIEFASWFIQPENLGTLSVREPSRISATNVAPWNNPEYQQVFKAAMNSRSLPTVPQWSEIQQIIIVELQKVMQGSSTAQQAADSIASQADALLANK